MNPSKSDQYSRHAPLSGSSGACAYVVGFALPLPWNIPLLGLVLMGAFAVVSLLVSHVRSLPVVRLRVQLSSPVWMMEFHPHVPRERPWRLTRLYRKEY